MSFGNPTAWKPKSDLPLYKDKPNTYPSSTENKKKIFMLFKGFLISLGLYMVYHYTIGSSGSLLGGGKKGAALTWPERQQEVKDVFLESWASYEKNAWGKDVYHPVSKRGENMGPQPLGWIIVDSLDTLMLMDCQPELARARQWVKKDLDYSFNYDVSVFETTIRMLGGLLSAFHFSDGDDMYLDKAADLANAMIKSFESGSGIPYASVNLETGEGVKNHVDGGASSTAEVATLQLEFKYLAKLTGEAMFWEKVEKVMEVLEANDPQDGLVPIYVHPDTGKYQGKLIRLGSRGDSYYEYLLKQYLQTSNEEPVYWQMYRESVEGVKKHLVGYSRPNKLAFIGELEYGIGGGLSTKMDHLVCFYGGLLALGATNGLTYEEAKAKPDWTAEKESDFKLAQELTYTCYKMYHDVPATGLSPEIVVFNQDGRKNEDFYIKPADRHNLQRPETVESLFILYRLTKDEKYRQWGYEIFQNFVEHTKIVDPITGEVSYTTLDDVTTTPARKGDNMESFWLAETLKYLYLLFDDDNKVPLDKYVFNTEAHPFPRFDMKPLFKTGWKRSGQEDAQPKRPSNGNEDVKVDKKHPPQAAPANKKVDDEVREVVKENPNILDEEKESEKKVEQLLNQL
ncbi:endoplasmic reticulum mannosyl-oligosaccharide 1,2-alpha-mannosidase [[Candida] anglica]|uniref:alpha-1,2-Mannosidase n=1 Tax=[Candida] anglica TaxID=148631 RepID=A0ABP0E5X2_9ASCO